MTSVASTGAPGLPVAAAPAQPQAAAGQGGGLVPTGNFVPLTQGVPGGQTAPAGQTQAAPTGQAQGAPAQAPAPQQQGIDAKEGIALLKERFGQEYGDPLVSKDGMVYMELREPDVKEGKIVLRYVLAAKIDAQTGRMALNPAFFEAQKTKRPPGSKLVKVEDQYFWQVMQKGEDGQLTARMVPVSQAELQTMSANMQQQEAQTQLEAWNKNRVDWIQKLSEQSSLMKAVGYTGGLVESLSKGPDPYTGKSQAHWYTGYMVAQMLDARSGGKLLPEWMKTGPFATALEWGLQGWAMLDIGQSLGTLAQAFPRGAAAMRAFTSPTRAVLQGVLGLGKGVAAATAPAGVAAAQAGGVAASNMGLAAQAMGAAQATGAAAGTGGAASGAIAGALNGLGKSITTGGAAVVGTRPMTQLGAAVAENATIMSANGTLSMVPKSVLHAAIGTTNPPLTGGLKLQQGISNGVTGALSALQPFLRTLQVGGSIFGAVAGALNITRIVKNEGYKSLVTTQGGFGAVTNFLASGSFLGMLALPVLAAPLGLSAAAVGVGYAALNVASNVFSGVSMLNNTGLFGDGGWLDHDGVRAAFLIPPLTPIGLFAMWSKRRKKQEAEKAKQLEEAKKTVQQKVTAVRTQAASQLQQAGAVNGAVQQEDGSLVVSTEVPNDLREVAGEKKAPELSSGTSRTLQLISRPMR